TLSDLCQQAGNRYFCATLEKITIYPQINIALSCSMVQSTAGNFSQLGGG
ncbi:hypothetical protein HMPREF9538_05733, partial [Klebsiella sp. MS 92-3]